MRTLYSYSLGLALLLSFALCSTERGHFIGDADYRAKVAGQFEAQKGLATHRAEALFGVFNENLTVEEKEALEFLYAYMPLNDLADYSGDFFLRQVRIALEARNTFSWGKRIPEDIFRHYVLPYRVNTENLDEARTVFFNELKDRVKNLTLKEAILEVNHWSHEKVTYEPSDRRTSAPLATMKSTLGRCGEETVFTITALRAVGIPARQVYVPRWAHTESNHAWIEAWVDGTWHYLGACEPEPALDMAWFTEPVKRAMILSSIVIGEYEGPENVTEKTVKFTRINPLEHYAPATELTVTAFDGEGNPVENADVDFRIFNSGQLASIGDRKTNADGMCSLTLGHGDVLVWVSSGNNFGYEKVSVDKQNAVTVVLDKNPDTVAVEHITMAPPPTGDVTPISEKGREENNRRLQFEDSLRHSYMATFMDSASAFALADELSLVPTELWNIVKESRGNWNEIVEFLKAAPAGEKKRALAMLSAVSPKDLHDTPADVFMDHLAHSVPKAGNVKGLSEEDYARCLLSPKVGSEILTAYRQFFQAEFGDDFIQRARQDISVILDWLRENIRIDDEANYYQVPITPRGVYELKVSDTESRNALFVALSRSFGIPARTSFSSRNPEYFSNGTWHEANPEKTDQPSVEKGFIALKNTGKNASEGALSFRNLRLARFSNGDYVPVFFGGGFGRGARRGFDLSKPQEVETGSYLLTTSNRLESGTALLNMYFFSVQKGKSTPVEFEIPTEESGMQIYGKLALDNTVQLVEGRESISLGSRTGKNGLVLAWIDPDREPTKHALGDFQSLKREFERLDVNILFLLNEDRITASFNPKSYDLPEKHCFAIDKNGLLHTSKFTTSSNLPVIMVANARGEVTYLSQGYRIGIGEQVVRALNDLQ